MLAAATTTFVICSFVTITLEHALACSEEWERKALDNNSFELVTL